METTIIQIWKEKAYGLVKALYENRKIIGPDDIRYDITQCEGPIDDNDIDRFHEFYLISIKGTDFFESHYTQNHAQSERNRLVADIIEKELAMIDNGQFITPFQVNYVDDGKDEEGGIRVRGFRTEIGGLLGDSDAVQYTIAAKGWSYVECMVRTRDIYSLMSNADRCADNIDKEE